VERDEPKKMESVGQTLPQLPWKQKRRNLKNIWIPFIKLHESLQEYKGKKNTFICLCIVHTPFDSM
jgi:hypothetical protein